MKKWLKIVAIAIAITAVIILCWDDFAYEEPPKRIILVLYYISWFAISYFIIRDKGRSGWWILLGGLGGMVGVLILALLPNLNRRILEEKVESLRNKLSNKELLGQLKIGTVPKESICLRCGFFSAKFQICTYYKQEIPVPVLECKAFSESES